MKKEKIRVSIVTWITENYNDEIHAYLSNQYDVQLTESYSNSNVVIIEINNNLNTQNLRDLKKEINFIKSNYPKLKIALIYKKKTTQEYAFYDVNNYLEEGRFTNITDTVVNYLLKPGSISASEYKDSMKEENIQTEVLIDDSGSFKEEIVRQTKATISGLKQLQQDRRWFY